METIGDLQQVALKHIWTIRIEIGIGVKSVDMLSWNSTKGNWNGFKHHAQFRYNEFDCVFKFDAGK